MKALGATSIPMVFNQVYDAMKQGVVDGSENPLSNIYTKKMHEVQRHITLSNHGYLGYGVICNKAFWDSLNPEQRSLITLAMNETTAYERSIAQQENDEALAKILAASTSKVHILTEDERTQWINALMPVQIVFEELVGKENLQELLEISQQALNDKTIKPVLPKSMKTYLMDYN
jgi:C4-dicarboxylate-binding protein DctP